MEYHSIPREKKTQMNYEIIFMSLKQMQWLEIRHSHFNQVAHKLQSISKQEAFLLTIYGKQ